MSKKNDKKIAELKEWMVGKGYKEDRWGSMKKFLDSGTEHRYKFKKTSLRSEVKLSGSKDWYKRWASYYKDVLISPDDKITTIKVLR